MLPEFLIRFLIRLIARVSYRLNVAGQENIPPEGPAVLICNHVSFVDWLLIGAAVNRPVRFVIDYTFMRGWLLKWVLRSAKVIPIAGPREDPARLGEAYGEVSAELRRGGLVCIFPEGRITFDGTLGPFKPGIMKILKQTPVPVVPMALHGLWGSTFSRMGGRALHRWPRRVRPPVELHIGKQLPPEVVKIALLEERVRALLGSGDS